MNRTLLCLVVSAVATNAVAEEPVLAPEVEDVLYSAFSTCDRAETNTNRPVTYYQELRQKLHQGIKQATSMDPRVPTFAGPWGPMLNNGRIQSVPKELARCEAIFQKYFDAQARVDAELEAFRANRTADEAAAAKKQAERTAATLAKLKGGRHDTFKRRGMPSSFSGSLETAPSWTYSSTYTDAPGRPPCLKVVHFKGDAVASTTASGYCR